MQLLFDYPWYYIFFCLVAGALYSAVLYGYRKGNGGDVLPRWARIGMPILRFVSVSLIAILLMGPLVKRKVNSQQRPIVVVATDGSESITTPLPDGWSKPLEKDYDVVLDTFGGKSTDIAGELASIAERYAGRNLGAVVLASDGIYNQGQNPTHEAANMGAPIYTIAMGDTTHHVDAAIAAVRVPKVAYMGNQFPMEVTIKGYGLKGEQAVLAVALGGQRQYSQTINYTENQYTTTIPITLKADKAGLQSYTITLSTLKGEANGANNSRTVAIEVLDGHQKIAIIAAAPHPDVSALKQAIEGNPNYEVTVMADKFDVGQLREYSVVILHNLPTASQPLTQLASLQVPTIYIIGSQTDLGRFNAMHTGLEIIAKAKKTDEATASHNNSFALFDMDGDLCRELEQMPPLQSPFGNYRTAGNVQALFTAKIGTVASDRPLIAFGQSEGVRRAFVAGEGLWRWRLQDYLMTSSHSHFDQLIEKMVVYTSLQANKDRLHLIYNHIYAENETVTLGAELYNDNYELVNIPEMRMKLTDASGGRGAEYEMNRSGSSYSLNLATLTPGHYKMDADATLAGKKYQATGTFVVEELNLEQINTVADHALLNTLAQTTGGQMVAANQTSRIAELLKAREDLKKVIYTHTRYTELLDIPWILLLIVLLLGAEWASRKYNDLW